MNNIRVKSLYNIKTKGEITMKKQQLDQLIIKIPGEKLPKVIETSVLGKQIVERLNAAYNDSVIYAPNLTATKSQKLSALFEKNIRSFHMALGDEPDATEYAATFCSAFEFDSVNTPICVHLIQYLAKHRNLSYINLDILVDLYSLEYNYSVAGADLYNDFENWKYYRTVKDCVGGVSIVKFMRFVLGIFASH